MCQNYYPCLWASAETTLIKLTNAYCTFVNGGKKVTPNIY